MKTREAIIGLFNQNFNKVTHLSDLDEFIDSLGEHRKTYPAQTHTPEIEHKHVFGKKIHKRYGQVIVFTLNNGQHFAYMSHTPMKKVNGTTHKSVNTHTVVVPKNATETHVFNIERIEVGLNASYSISVESYL